MLMLMCRHSSWSVQQRKGGSPQTALCPRIGMRREAPAAVVRGQSQAPSAAGRRQGHALAKAKHVSEVTMAVLFVEQPPPLQLRHQQIDDIVHTLGEHIDHHGEAVGCLRL